MSGLLKSVLESHNNFFKGLSDPRTQNWFMVTSPTPLLIIVAFYLYFCAWIGPMYMQNKKPFVLANALIVYNVLQVLISIYIVEEHYFSGWGTHYNLACEPVDYSNDPVALRMAASVWSYYMAKIIELLDTVFFVLRKKNNQITFLHLYHHSMMPVCGYLATRYVAGGHGTMLGLVNSFIHVIMYSYYLVASLGPKYQKYLWWKKYLTQLQLIQFCILFFHNLQVLGRECTYPKLINCWLLFQAMVFLFLFGRFYIQSYKIKRRLLTKNNVPNGTSKIQ